MSGDFLWGLLASTSDDGIERVCENVRIDTPKGLGRQKNDQLNTVLLVFSWA